MKRHKQEKAAALSAPSDLKKTVASVLGFGIGAGADETEVQLD